MIHPDEWQMPCGARVWGEDGIGDHEDECDECPRGAGADVREREDAS